MNFSLHSSFFLCSLKTDEFSTTFKFLISFSLELITFSFPHVYYSDYIMKRTFETIYSRWNGELFSYIHVLQIFNTKMINFTYLLFNSIRNSILYKKRLFKIKNLWFVCKLHPTTYFQIDVISKKVDFYQKIWRIY